MQSPRKITWHFSELRASSVSSPGGLAHYFSEDAQSLYLKNGIVTNLYNVDKGRFETAEVSDPIQINDAAYTNMSWCHPSTGSIYGVANNSGSLYLLRYTYAKDVSNLIERGTYTAQTDNPICQFSADLKNIDNDMFTKDTSLFIPTAKVTVGMYMGDSEMLLIGKTYLDEVSLKTNGKTVSISGRNSVGYLLNDQTFDTKATYQGAASNVIETILSTYGVEKYVIEENATVIKYPHEASDSILRGLQEIADMLSDSSQIGATWGYEESPDGTLIAGYDEFRSRYLAKGHYQYSKSELFARNTMKNVDGAYSKVYCQGENSNGKSLTPVTVNVSSFPYWNVSPHKTFFATPLKDATQAQLEAYAQVIAAQLQYTGLTESYDGPIRPQLLVGDVADLQEEDGEYKTLGTITEITHSIGARGFKTSFTVASGGDSADVGTGVYSASRRNKGDNRKKRITDFLNTKVTGSEVIKSLGFTPISSDAKGSAGGVAPVGTDGKIPAEFIPASGGRAIDISYDNDVSGLEAENVQDALDEVVDDIPENAADIGAVDEDSVITAQEINELF